MKTPAVKEIKTKVKTMEKEIQLQKSILDVIQDPFFILNQKGEFLNANPKGLEIFGYPLEDLRQMIFIDGVALEDTNQVKMGFEEMEQGKEVRFKTHIISRSGERIPVELLGTIKGEAYFITLRDLRERIKIEEEWEKTKQEFMEKIRERDQYARELQVMKDLFKEKAKEVEKMREEAILLSYTDDLTGIYNHRFFIQQMTIEVERQKRYSTPFSILMIDIDYFKHYNDTNGHLAGDQVLKTISIIIQHAVRQTDIVARYGGEEFVAILINAGKEKAKEIAERVRIMIAETSFLNEKEQPNGDLTVSIGVATFSPAISTLTDLIREADNALYRAKKAGRNRVEG